MISWLQESIDVGLNLALFILIFAPLERAFAAKRQPFIRKNWSIDLAFYLVQSLFFTKLTLFVLVWLHQICLRYVGRSSWLVDLPVFMQLILIILISDFMVYWAHRLSHKSSFLWRFHKVHHTAEHLDWLAAFREHPFDNIFTRVVVNMPVLLLGLPIEIIAPFAVFRGLWGNFIHSNTDVNLGPLKYFLGSPGLHHWHHDIEMNSSVNFANMNPLMDLMFNTFYDPGKMPQRYGIEDTLPQKYWVQMVAPLLPSRLASHFSATRGASAQKARSTTT